MAVTQQDIADLAGVSRATVYRTFNNTGPVKPEVAARIKKIAAELGYEQNLAGTLLVRSKRPLKVAVLIQSANSPFMKMLAHFTEEARPDFSAGGCEVLIYTSRGNDADEQLGLIEKAIAEGIDGLALAPATDSRITTRLQELAKQNIPVVTFNSDSPASKRLCFVGQDSFQAGRTAAGLMNGLIGGKGRILMMTGFLQNLSHQQRLGGFFSEVKVAFPGLELLPPQACHDDEAEAYRLVTAALQQKESIAGIYHTAGGQQGITQALLQAGQERSVRLICFDLTDENRQDLLNDSIDFVVDQDARTQATRPVQILMDYLLQNKKPVESWIPTAIDIYTKYNI